MNCGFSKFKEVKTNVNKELYDTSLKPSNTIVLYKTTLNTIYTGSHDVFLEKITNNSPRNGSPLLPQKTGFFNEVMLQSFNNGTTIRILDVQENSIDINHLYSYSTLKRMQVKIIDPEEPHYASDCLVYAYEYINFLKEHNIKYPYSELYVLYNAPELENAFWNGYYLTFGNGLKKESYPFVSPAIVGHELTHSLIQSSVNLEYYGQSGALNESYSDIIGVMFEFYLYEKHKGIGYEIGNELFKDGHSLRSFEDPNKCDHPKSIRDILFYRGKQDNGGVHINSSIINHLFWRMSQIKEKKIIFDIFMRVFFKLKNNSTFNDFKYIISSYILDNLDLVNILNTIL